MAPEPRPPEAPLESPLEPPLEPPLESPGPGPALAAPAPPLRQPEPVRRRAPEPEPPRIPKRKEEAPAPPPVPPEPLPPCFTPKRFHFTAGVAAGETAQIYDDDAQVLLTYRGFASIIGIVSTLIASMVILFSVAAAVFLFIEKNTLSSIGALVLGFFFALVVMMLIPALNVTLFSGTATALKITQVSRSTFPSTQWAVTTPDGRTLALLRKNVLARLGRNRWILSDVTGRKIGTAVEESFGRALSRKIAGKFDRSYEANVNIAVARNHVATIYRRPDDRGAVDMLHIFDDAIDHRVALALAALTLGSEP